MIQRRRRSSLALLALVLLMTASACMCPRSLAPYYPFASPICLEAPYSPPSPSFEESDLVGTWEADYAGWPRRAVDRLIFRNDGTFKQFYEDYRVGDYTYETQWTQWWVESSPDGRVRVHLPGARCYKFGISTAELDGLAPPCPTSEPGCTGEPRLPPQSFYDPFAREYLKMAGELVLNVRVDSAGELLLHHMWSHAGVGFAISGCEAAHFRRVETP
jgi:hypothetical protein